MQPSKLIAAARLERERAQKAQYTAMILRQWSARTRERYGLLRCAVAAQREFPLPPLLWSVLLALLSRQLPDRAGAP